MELLENYKQLVRYMGCTVDDNDIIMRKGEPVVVNESDVLVLPTEHHLRNPKLKDGRTVQPWHPYAELIVGTSKATQILQEGLVHSLNLAITSTLMFAKNLFNTPELLTTISKSDSKELINVDFTEASKQLTYNEMIHLCTNQQFVRLTPSTKAKHGFKGYTVITFPFITKLVQDKKFGRKTVNQKTVDGVIELFEYLYPGFMSNYSTLMIDKTGSNSKISPVTQSLLNTWYEVVTPSNQLIELVVKTEDDDDAVLSEEINYYPVDNFKDSFDIIQYQYAIKGIPAQALNAGKGTITEPPVTEVVPEVEKETAKPPTSKKGISFADRIARLNNTQGGWQPQTGTPVREPNQPQPTMSVQSTPNPPVQGIQYQTVAPVIQQIPVQQPMYPQQPVYPGHPLPPGYPSHYSNGQPMHPGQQQIPVQQPMYPQQPVYPNQQPMNPQYPPSMGQQPYQDNSLPWETPTRPMGNRTPGRS